MTKRNQQFKQKRGQLKESIKHDRLIEEQKEKQALKEAQKQNQQESSPDDLDSDQLEDQLDPFSKRNCLIQLVYIAILVVAMGFLIYYLIK